MTTRIRTTQGLLDNLPFIKRALAVLPKSQFTPEQRIEAIRKHITEGDFGVWVAPDLFCVAFINTDLMGTRSCHLWALTAFPGAKTSDFIKLTLEPWSDDFVIDNFTLWDKVGTSGKSRLLTSYGMRKLANVWVKER